MKYAIGELWSLKHRMSETAGFQISEPVAYYLCSLMSELAYHHVLEYELDFEEERIKLVPSTDFQRIALNRMPTDVRDLRDEIDLPVQFIVYTDNVIAIGVSLDDTLFVSMRGTVNSYDIRVNANILLVNDVNLSYDKSNAIYNTGGKRHAGFLLESQRIAVLLKNKLREFNGIDKLVFVGHSLGGAIAAISSVYFQEYSPEVCVLGCPRFTDVTGRVNCYSNGYLHIRRHGDCIPNVPPRSFGYTNHTNEITTEGEPYIDAPSSVTILRDSKQWFQFFRDSIVDHEIKAYRCELGKNADSDGYCLPFSRYSKIGK